MAHELIINSIQFPVTRQISYGGEYVGEETIMASGKIMYDRVGFRPSVTYTYDWLPDAIMKQIHTLLQNGRVYNVTYISPKSNTAVTEQCVIDYPNADLFTFRGSTPVWHNAEITFRAVNVR